MENKTLLHSKNYGRISYPVGDSISGNSDKLKKMCKSLYKIIKKYYPDKQSIILFVRGSSGAIIAGYMSFYLEKKLHKINIHYIKKEGEDRHQGTSYFKQSHTNEIKIVVDDFICSGETVLKIIEYLTPYSEKVDILCVSGKTSEPEIKKLSPYFTHIIQSTCN